MPRIRTFLAALSLLVLTFASASATTVYFAGGEDLDFARIGTAALDQTANHFRSAFSRGDLGITASGSQGYPSANVWRVNNVFSVTSLWLHARVWFANQVAGSTTMIALTTSDSVERIILATKDGGGGCNPTSGGCMYVFKRTAAGSNTQIGSALTCNFSAAPSVPDTVDVNLTSYATPASGTISIYINNTLCFQATGQTLATDSATALNGIDLGGTTQYNSILTTGWSEVIAADTDTRSMALFTNYPQGNGNTQAWTCTSGTYASVNAWNTVAAGDPQNCSVGTATQLEEFSGGSCPSGNWSIAGVVTSVRGAYTTGGPTGIEHDVRSGGTSYQSSNIPQTTSFQLSQYDWATNPNTSASWTCSQINLMNYGTESHS